jgi:hypothetical protein
MEIGRGATMLVNIESYELLILGCSCNPSVDGWMNSMTHSVVEDPVEKVDSAPRFETTVDKVTDVSGIGGSLDDEGNSSETWTRWAAQECFVARSDTCPGMYATVPQKIE